MDKRSNAYAALIVIVLIGILFMGYWAVMPAFSKIYNYFSDDTEFNTRFTNEADCISNGGSWTGTVCNQLDDRAKDVIAKQRKTWLTLPFIVVIGLILWYWTAATRKDYQQFGGP